MSELKAGGSMDFTVDEKVLTIKPLPFGRLKNVLKTIAELSQEAGAGKFETQGIIALVEQYSGKILPELIYPKQDIAWIDDHLDLPTIRKMIEAAVVVNGLQDFLGKGKVGSLLLSDQPTPKSPTEPTPSVSIGSTTSSDSPTAGGPKT